MQCPFCEGEIRDGAIWCRHCQRNLDEDEETAPHPVVKEAPAAPASPQSPQTPPSPPLSPLRPRSDGVSASEMWKNAEGIEPDRASAIMARNVVEQRKAERAAVLNEIRTRAQQIDALMRAEDYRTAMQDATLLCEYIRHAGDFGDKTTQEELRNMRSIVARLERMGINTVDPDLEGTVDPVRTLHFEYFIAFITMVALVGGAFYGFTHLVKSSIKEAADAPGAVVGHVRTPTTGGLRGAGGEPVLVLGTPGDKGEVQVMVGTATDVDQLWGELRQHSSTWKVADRVTTDANGQFTVNGLKPGIYTVVATASKPHMSWALDARIEPGLRVELDMTPENCIKPHPPRK